MAAMAVRQDSSTLRGGDALRQDVSQQILIRSTVPFMSNRRI